MSRYIPEHPPKGSVEAYEWAEKMRQAREKKARTRARIREAGLKVEKEFFGPGGPLEVKNPDEDWHKEAAHVAEKRVREAMSIIEKALYKGMQVAHSDSARAAKAYKTKDTNRAKSNPLAIYNPPANVAGTVYNKAIEIRAEKTGGPLKGRYKHVFGKNVKILGLDNGDVLIHHTGGKRLWITREEYERSGKSHH